VMASFAVEDFSIERLATVTSDEIRGRYRSFEQLTRFPGLENEIPNY